MTKLDYTKVSERDPGRVIEVRESAVWSGNDSHPFEPESKRRARQARERAALAARSEAIRYEAIIKKFGEQHAIEIGVPRGLVEALRRAKDREKQRQERARLKRERHAAKRAAGLKVEKPE